MPTPVQRRTVDLSQYPDLVVIYLGMRVSRLTGIKTLMGLRAAHFKVRGRAARRSAAA